jgi:hypothetical protein
MTPLGNGDYMYTLDARYPAFLPSYPKTLQLNYQFIAIHLDTSTTTSPVYNDITLQGLWIPGHNGNDWFDRRDVSGKRCPSTVHR